MGGLPRPERMGMQLQIIVQVPALGSALNLNLNLPPGLHLNQPPRPQPPPRPPPPPRTPPPPPRTAPLSEETVRMSEVSHVVEQLVRHVEYKYAQELAHAHAAERIRILEAQRLAT